MKILITVKKKGWSGETAMLLDLATGFQARGHEVYLAAKAGSVTEGRARAAGLPVKHVVFETGFMKTPSKWRDFKELGRFIAEKKIDLVHAHASWDNWIGGFTAKKGPRPVPMIRTKHNLKLIRTHLMNKWLYRTLTDYIIAPSKAVRDHLCSCPIVRSERVHYIPNGIRADLFSPEGRDPRAVRETLGVKPHEILVSFISRLSERKNPEGFIDAARLLEGSGLPLRFALAGEGAGDYPGRLRERAKGLDRVQFLGHWDDVPGLLSATDIFVLVSHKEPFGLAPLEAMAMQKPVVVSSASGFRDYLDPDRNGIMLKENRAQDLAEAVARLARDEELRKRLGEQGRRTVEKDFTSDLMVDRTLAFYERVLEAEKLPAGVH